eukprot:767488-Hanusia_phi.AAC.3
MSGMHKVKLGEFAVICVDAPGQSRSGEKRASKEGLTSSHWEVRGGESGGVRAAGREGGRSAWERVGVSKGCRRGGQGGA